MQQIVTVGDAAEGFGCTPKELTDVLCDRHLAELSAHETRMQRCGGRPDNVVLPMIDEGDEIGRVEARIPAALFFNLLQRPNFGWEGLTSDEGMRDILRDTPQARVKTVSGKIVSGWTPGSSTRRTVKKY